MLVLFTGFFNPLPKWGEPRSRGNHTAIILFHFGELYSDWAGRKLLSSYIYLYNIYNYSLKTHMEASKSCHCKPWGKSIFENQSVVWLRWVFDGSFRETSSDDLDHLYGAPEHRFKASIIDPVGNSAPQPACFAVWWVGIVMDHETSTFETMVCNVDTIHLQHCNVFTRKTVHLQRWLFSVPMWICIHCFSAPVFFLETDTN